MPVQKLAIFQPKGIISENTQYISEQFKTKLTPEEESKFRSDFKDKLGEEHPFEYKTIENLTKKFGLISAILDKISDFTLGPGISIESKHEDQVKIIEQWIRKNKFKSKLPSWFKEGLSKGSSYLEVAGLSDKEKESMVKNVSSDSIFIKRNDVGEIEEYNQFVGNDLNRIGDDDINTLIKDDIIQLDINKIGNGAYGYGIVFAGLGIINNFLQAQKDAHTLMERKSGAPLHVKLGDSEKEDYPEQADIDAFGNKLQFMNSATEWVTGPNVEMNVIDFGNISEKFEAILLNDLKLLSYVFQVPETIMGASQAGGLSATGQNDVQMDAFERNIKSYQEQIGFVIATKIFDLVLINSGVPIESIDYEIIWGEQSEDDKREKIKAYSELLGKVSEGLKKQIEERIANIEDFDVEEIERENKRMERRTRQEGKVDFDRQLQLVDQKQKMKPNAKEELNLRDVIKNMISENISPQEIEIEINKIYKNKFNFDIYEIIMEEYDGKEM